MSCAVFSGCGPERSFGLLEDRQYGFDPVLEYADVYFPHVAKGMNVRVGRFISIPGIEAQLTPNNYIFSHSVLYAVDPFTDTGVLATIQVNDQWVVQAGISDSHDVALWTDDAKPSFMGCVSYTTKSSFQTSIAPWLSVRNSAQAVNFYKSAFGATEVYRLEDPDGNVVARLSVNGAEFWLSDESPEHGNFSPESLGGGTVRIILTVADPDAVFAQARAAGALEVFPVGEEHGWRLGRIVDPYGHHWEIGREVGE